MHGNAEVPEPNPDYRLGVVEGFFGRQWSWQARHDYTGFLAAHGCNSYVYAPKNDVWLRKQWHVPCPADHVEALQAMAGACRRHALDFGIGLSPFELYRDFSATRQSLLLQKLQQINSIAPQTLCILFDDMMGNLENLATVQLEIVDFIVHHSTASRFVVCPTYYSSDPLLAQHFGPGPERYLEDIGAGLDTGIEVFWTGPKVISTTYPRTHLMEIAGKLRRKPLLWDNYPVNDAKRLAPFLNLQAFTGRSRELRALCSGHLANPMNQACLSQVPLATLAALYTEQAYDPDRAFMMACRELCPPELAAALVQDAAVFQQRGLDGLTDDERQSYWQRYAVFAHPMAMEVCAWLKGEYDFDPACLT